MPGHAVVERAGARLRVGDEFLQGRSRHRRMHRQHARHDRHVRHRGEVAQGVVGQVFHHERIHHMRRQQRTDRVAVGCGARDDVARDHESAARPVVHQHGLPHRLGEALRDQARDQVVGAAGRDGDDPAHRPRRERLCRYRLRNEQPGQGEGRRGEQGRAAERVAHHSSWGSSVRALQDGGSVARSRAGPRVASTGSGPDAGMECTKRSTGRTLRAPRTDPGSQCTETRPAHRATRSPPAKWACRPSCAPRSADASWA